MSKMVQRLKFFSLCFAICFLNFVQEVKSEVEALVFNFELKRLEEPKNVANLFGIMNNSCITACPASSSKHDETNETINHINREQSITGNGVFTRNVYNFKPVTSMEMQICEESFKPALVIDTSKTSYDTGYELFHREKYGNIHLHYNKYNNLKNVYGQKTYYPTPEVYKIQDTRKTEFGTSLYRTDLYWTFFWIPVLSIQADHSQRQITYAKDSIGKDTQPSDFASICKGYNAEDNTQFELSQIRLQRIKQIVNPPGCHNLADYLMEQANVSLELRETQIMPMRYFHTFSAKLATCTELNLAYVWKDIATDQYQKVDNYLYSLYRTAPANVNITFGVQGRIDELCFHQSHELYSKQNLIVKRFPMPVPSVLYRIVEYYREGIVYNVIIVIHNNINPVPEKNRICSRQSEVEGWEKIKTRKEDEGSVPGLTYACSVTSEAIEKLKIVYNNTPIWMEDFVLDDKQKKIISEKWNDISISG